MTSAFMRSTRRFPVCWGVPKLALAGCIWAGCAQHADEAEPATRTADLAVAGPWQIPPAVRAAGDAADVPYVGAGPWIGEEGCSGGVTDRAAALRELLIETFPQIAFIGDYACRPIGTSGTRMSVHGVGRALDVHIPAVLGGEADNELGDPVGNWLVENAEAHGVQYVIWDGWQWRSNLEPGAKDGPYGGSNPHRDHLHVEVTPAVLEPPDSGFRLDATAVEESCPAVPAPGALIDECGPCVRRYGPEEFWRLDESTGHDGSLYWTNAFVSDVPSNWARYSLWFEEAGDYLLRVHVPPGYACFDAVRYEVRHAEGLTAVTVDQSISQGWVSLGTHFFVAGEEQWVDVFDDTHAAVEAERHIVVDALQAQCMESRGDQAPGEETGMLWSRHASPPVESAPTAAASAAEALPAESPVAEESTSPESAKTPESGTGQLDCASSPARGRASPNALAWVILMAWLRRRVRSAR